MRSGGPGSPRAWHDGGFVVDYGGGGMIRKILATMLFCEEKNLPWVLMHIPVGVANVLIPVVLYWIYGMPGAIIGGALAVIFGAMFATFEIVEYHVIKDVVYPDLQGWLWGVVLGVVLTLIVNLAL